MNSAESIKWDAACVLLSVTMRYMHAMTISQHARRESRDMVSCHPMRPYILHLLHMPFSFLP